MGNPVHSRAGSIASPAIACLTAPTAPDTSTRLPNRPTESHRPGPRLSSPACCPADPAPAPLPRTAIGAPNDNQRPPPAPFIGIERGPSRPTALTPCSNPKAAPHRWIRAKGLVLVTVVSSLSTELAPSGRESGQDCERAYGHAPIWSLLMPSMGLVGRLENKSTDHIQGIAPVPFRVRPEPRRPGWDYRSPIFADGLQSRSWWATARQCTVSVSHTRRC